MQAKTYMNWPERQLVHNIFRWYHQRYREIPILLDMGLELKGKYALEVGCGNGRAAKAMVQKYGADHVHGVDLDLSALKRSSWVPGTSFAARDVTNLEYPDASFEAVVGFGLLHHLERWQDAVAEISRVLKPGAQYAMDDFTKYGLDKWYHRIFEAPRGNEFTTGQLIREIEKNGMDIEEVTHRFGGNVVFLVARKK